MQAFYNHAGELIAYQYQNMLIHPDSFQVLGIVLGNCVFGNQAKMLGKLFQQKVYSLNGEVLASKSDASLPEPATLDAKGCVRQAWQIVVKIKDHVCPWVNARDAWSRASLAESLYLS